MGMKSKGQRLSLSLLSLAFLLSTAGFAESRRRGTELRREFLLREMMRQVELRKELFSSTELQKLASKQPKLLRDLGFSDQKQFETFVGRLKQLEEGKFANEEARSKAVDEVMKTYRDQLWNVVDQRGGLLTYGKSGKIELGSLAKSLANRQEFESFSKLVRNTSLGLEFARDVRESAKNLSPALVSAFELYAENQAAKGAVVTPSMIQGVKDLALQHKRLQEKFGAKSEEAEAFKATVESYLITGAEASEIGQLKGYVTGENKEEVSDALKGLGQLMSAFKKGYHEAMLEEVARKLGITKEEAKEKGTADLLARWEEKLKEEGATPEEINAIKEKWKQVAAEKLVEKLREAIKEGRIDEETAERIACNCAPKSLGACGRINPSLAQKVQAEAKTKPDAGASAARQLSPGTKPQQNHTGQPK